MTSTKVTGDMTSITKKELLRLSTKELQKMCRKSKCQTTGNKSELIERILNECKKTQNKQKKNKQKKNKSISKKLSDLNLSHLSIDKYLSCLVNGFIRCIDINVDTNDIPSALTLLIINYLWNIFMNFDTFSIDYTSCVYDYGMMIKRGKNYYVTEKYKDYDYAFSGTMTTEQFPIPFIIGCSKGFNNNIHEFKIKIISGSNVWKQGTFLGCNNNHDCIGITTDFKKIYKQYETKCKFENLKLFTGYYWMNDLFIKYGKKPYVGYEYDDNTEQRLNQYWKQNDILTIHLNCNKWKLILKQNNKKITTTRLEKGKYYFVMLSYQPDTQYKLMSYS